MTSRRLCAGAAALLACAVAGCGGGGDEQDVEAAFHELRRAYLTEDYRGICAGLSSAAQRELGRLGHLQPTDCETDMRTNMSAAILSERDRAQPDVERVEVDDDQAVVLARLGGSTLGDVHFVKQRGRWRLDQLFGTTAPPAPDLE